MPLARARPMAMRHHHDVLASLAPECASFLEVGVRDGDSTRAVVSANTAIDLHLCDTWGRTHGGTGRGSHVHIDAMLAQVGHLGRVEYLDGRSQDRLPSLRGMVFDMVHIDGDHSYEVALSDLSMAWPLARRWMVVHDMFRANVRNAVFDFIDGLRVGGIGERVWLDVATLELSVSDNGTLIIARREEVPA